MKTIIPKYLLNPSVWIEIWPLIVLPTLASLGISFLYSIIAKRRFQLTDEDTKPRAQQRIERRVKSLRCECFILTMAFSTAGIIFGFLTGQSRMSIVGALVPATASLIGALSAFSISRKKDQRQRTNQRQQMGVAMLSISMFVLIGHVLGEERRDLDLKSEEESIRKYAVSEEYLNQLQLLAPNEARLNTFREDRNLPPLPYSSIYPINTLLPNQPATTSNQPATSTESTNQPATPPTQPAKQ